MRDIKKLWRPKPTWKGRIAGGVGGAAAGFLGERFISNFFRDKARAAAAQAYQAARASQGL
jgi:hypothetical protein